MFLKNRKILFTIIYFDICLCPVTQEGQCFVFKSQHTRAWKGFGILQLNPGKLLSCFSLQRSHSHSPSPFPTPHTPPHTHTVSLSVESTKRGQGRSMSVSQVVTQMMTNRPLLCSPPNRVQTWLSCVQSPCKWRSMEFRWSSLPLPCHYCHR